MIDPKDNTAVQRSWLPFKDKAIVEAEKNLYQNDLMNGQNMLMASNPLSTYKNNMKQTLDHDIATSLPIGGRFLFFNFLI